MAINGPRLAGAACRTWASHMDRAAVLASACSLINEKSIEDAAAHLQREYPHAVSSTSRRSWSAAQLTRVFIRDGFTDRYFGQRLVFPGTLRLLSILLPEAFPYHRNWKQSATHPAFYELSPTIDHVIPLARGGKDDESNVVTTSMVRNASKANWLVEELKWPSVRAPVAAGWDGLLSWFVSAWERHVSLQTDPALLLWHRAALQASRAPASSVMNSSSTQEGDRLQGLEGCS